MRILGPDTQLRGTKIFVANLLFSHLRSQQSMMDMSEL